MSAADPLQSRLHTLTAWGSDVVCSLVEVFVSQLKGTGSNVYLWASLNNPSLQQHLSEVGQDQRH